MLHICTCIAPFIGWANNHFNNLHFTISLETRKHLKWEWGNH